MSKDDRESLTNEDARRPNTDERRDLNVALGCAFASALLALAVLIVYLWLWTL